jgi:hypothetical protein
MTSIWNLVCKGPLELARKWMVPLVAVAASMFITGMKANAQPSNLKGIVLGGAYDTLSFDVSSFADHNARLARYQLYLSFSDPRLPTFTIAQHVAWINAVMPTIRQRGMILVVDFHVPNRSGGSFLVNQPNLFYDDWERIVAGVGHHPSQNLWFELANEQTSPNWPSIALNAAQRIRQVEQRRGFQQHTICYSPTGATTAGARSIQKLAIPGPQALTFHFWNWGKPFQDVQNSDPSLFRRYGPQMPNRNAQEIGRLLDAVKEAGLRNGCPTYISEVGIDYRHPDAVSFFNDFGRAAAARRISVTWHANDHSNWFGSIVHFQNRPQDTALFSAWFNR